MLNRLLFLLRIILILICYIENVCTKQEHCTNYKIGRDSYVCKKTSDEKFGFCIEGIMIRYDKDLFLEEYYIISILEI